jgi:rubrerythrin
LFFCKRKNRFYDNVLALLGRIRQCQGEILYELRALRKGAQRQEASMAEHLTRLTEEVRKTSTVAQSAVQLISGLADQLRAAATDPTRINELADELAASSSNLAAAIAANTTAEGETPTEEPTDGA